MFSTSCAKTSPVLLRNLRSDQMKSLRAFGISYQEQGHPDAMNTSKSQRLCCREAGKRSTIIADKGANVEIIDKSQETVLHKAASAGDEEVLQELPFRQININAKNSLGWTALHVAAANGRGSLVRLLLEVGADPEAATLRQINALHLALESKDESSIAVLLEKGSKVDARNADGSGSGSGSGSEFN